MTPRPPRELALGAVAVLYLGVGLGAIGVPLRAAADGLHVGGASEGAGYVEALIALEARIEAHAEAVTRQPSSWMALESLADAYAARAQLTGDYADFASAESLLARGFRIAPAGSGPHLARARLDFSLHRLDRIEEGLRIEDRVARFMPSRARVILALRAEVAAQQGRYEAAEAFFDSLLAGGRDTGDLARVASFVWGLGLQDSSATLWSEALERCERCAPQFQAWLATQHADLETERGELERAAERYAWAQDRFPGWWLVAERQARLAGLRGDRTGAIFAYESLADRTNHPETMDALAELLLEGASARDSARASRWMSRARALHEARLEQFPEAAIGHGLRHFLRFSDDADRIVALAERNRELRPGGEARTLLAQAYWRAGRVPDAEREIEAVLATPWRTPELHATAAILAAATQRGSLAETERRRADALSPWMRRRLEWLASMGHL